MHFLKLIQGSNRSLWNLLSHGCQFWSTAGTRGQKPLKIQATKIWSNKRLFGLFIFLRSLITKKSSCMEKPCVWVVFHPNDYPSQKNNFSWRYILGQDYWVLCITLGAPSHHNQFESLTLPSPDQHPKCLYVLSIKAHLAFPKSFCLLFQVLLNVTLHVHTCS